MANATTESSPLRRTVFIALTGLTTYILIPMGLDRYSEVKSLREERVARAIKFGDRNAEFVGKIHTEATLLSMFVDHNNRMNISGSQLEQARKELQENYRKLYLEIDGSEWWWPWEFEREVEALNLLSQDEMKQLHEYVEAYSNSASKTIYDPIHLWHFLDSPAYKVRDEKSNDEIKKLRAKIDSTFRQDYEKRADLVKKIAALLANSEFRTGLLDVAGFR